MERAETAALKTCAWGSTTIVATWLNIGTSLTSKTYDNYGGGNEKNVKVEFFGDGTSNGCDPNLFVDYIQVGSTTSDGEHGDSHGLRRQPMARVQRIFRLRQSWRRREIGHCRRRVGEADGIRARGQLSEPI
jgi:hypothetical protein